MTGLVFAVIIVAWFAAFWYTGYRALEDGSWWWAGATAALVIVALGAAINGAIAEDDSGPCLRHETRYTLVGKVMTPYRVCVERGEWVK